MPCTSRETSSLNCLTAKHCSGLMRKTDETDERGQGIPNCSIDYSYVIGRKLGSAGCPMSLVLGHGKALTFAQPADLVGPHLGSEMGDSHCASRPANSKNMSSPSRAPFPKRNAAHDQRSTTPPHPCRLIPSKRVRWFQQSKSGDPSTVASFLLCEGSKTGKYALCPIFVKFSPQSTLLEREFCK